MFCVNDAWANARLLLLDKHEGDSDVLNYQARPMMFAIATPAGLFRV